jgi:hypothetical protein
MTDDYLTRQRSHDYPHLLERWRAVAKRAALSMRRLATGPQFALYSVRTKRLPREGTIYISAGIHGDEPAGQFYAAFPGEPQCCSIQASVSS